MTKKNNYTAPEMTILGIGDAITAYAAACDNILRLFCEKHEMHYDSTDWVSYEPGTIAMIGDYFVDMATMLTDLKMNAPEEEFIQWYDYTLELGMIDPSITTPNFEHWLRGCPRYSQEHINGLRRAALRVQEAKNSLDELIRESKNLKY